MDDAGVLSPAVQKLVLHWGEMGSRWGVNRTVAQIHALLFASAEPLSAEEIASCLSVARSNVSTSLRELQRWGIVKVVHVLGDRRDYFEAMHDPWEMFRVIIEERKRRELDPTLQVLRDCLAEANEGGTDPRVRERLHQLQKLFETMSAWYGEIMSLPSAELKRLVDMGRRVRKVLRFEG
jgi:DNA-binding transcriptional regulator GbsR (MarR family)